MRLSFVFIGLIGWTEGQLDPTAEDNSCGKCEGDVKGIEMCEDRLPLYGLNRLDDCRYMKEILMPQREATVQSWTVNPETNETYPACQNMWLNFYCAQEPVIQWDRKLQQTYGRSPCSTYLRPISETAHQCFTFCPPIETACSNNPFYTPGTCQRECERIHMENQCQVVTVSGVPSRFSFSVTDINNKYRVMRDGDDMVMANQRPFYRSVAAERAYTGFKKKTYYLYSSRANGYDEWVFDRDDIEKNGGVAFAATSATDPTQVVSTWKIWDTYWDAFIPVDGIKIKCSDAEDFLTSGADRGMLTLSIRLMALSLSLFAVACH